MVRRFTVDDYFRMAGAGVFGPTERTELLDGRVFQMVPMGNRHVTTVDQLTAFFVQGLPERAIVRVQGTVVLSNLDAPEPDLTVLRWRPDFYKSTPAGAADVVLVIEVSDTSLGFDRTVKRPRYASLAIPEMWIVNLKDGQIEVATDPTERGYRSIGTVGRGETVGAHAFPDLALEIGLLLD